MRMFNGSVAIEEEFIQARIDEEFEYLESMEEEYYKAMEEEYYNSTQQQL